MIRRPRRTLPAALTAFVLLAASTAIAIAAIQLALGHLAFTRFTQIAEAAHTTRWSDLTPAAIGGTAVLIGLLLLLAAVVPGKPVVLPLAGEGDTGVSRRGLHNALRSAALIDGVSAATIRSRRNRVKAVVRTHRTTTDGLNESVRTALEQRLAQIELERQPQIVVTVKAPRRTP